MGFVERLLRNHGDRLHLYPKSEGKRLDLAAILAEAPAEAEIYACGPDRLLAELTERLRDRPERLHVEYFGTSAEQARDSVPFDVDLTDTGISLHVPADRSLLDVLRGAGIDVQSDCEEGLCGTCMVDVVEGEIDHRDKVLATSERNANSRMTACCSRALNGRLKIAL
ncbi:MAG: cytochrome [Alphaproteobacteria bacterium]|nr:cytochrome [Alphaproteobacteria bacterium]